MKSYEVAHQTDVHEIHRMSEAVAEREVLEVLFLFEIGEYVGAASGEEYFPGIA